MSKPRVKLRAGVLNLVLAICIIISAFVGAILLMAYHRNIVLSRESQILRLDRNANSGIGYILANKIEGTQEQILDLFGVGMDSVFIKNEVWGLYNLAQVKATSGKLNKYKCAFVGSGLDSLAGIALYLTDEDRPLFMAKGALIEGKCFLPRAGVKTVILGSQETKDIYPVNGKVSVSQIKLPEAFERVLKKVKNNVVYYPKHQNRVTPLTKENISQERIVSNSFFNMALLIQNDELLVLDNITVTGKIIINSKRGVILGPKVNTKDILISAPYIIISDNFKGSLQAFAQDSIIIGKGCDLQYPSALALYNEKTDAALVIGEGSVFTGEIIIGGGKAGKGLHQLTISKQVEINGLVYVDGLVEHQGKIFGGLFCRRLMLRTSSALYENYLMDASILGNSLSEFFLASTALSRNGRRELIKWLD